ncbi:MAG: ABC-F family ATP-binding cassette domain-containing protein, partial [Ignavibacteria bacterium]
MIDLSNISLQFGGKYLFRDVNYKINSGDKISLVGANGSGKSSLLKIIKGEIEPEKGKINRQKRISIGYLPQENVTHRGKTLLEEAKSALSDIIYLQEKEVLITSRLSAENISDEERNDLINQLGELHHRLEELDSFGAESKVEKILSGLGFQESDFSRATEEFSGGWQMRIALSKILISQNEIILLDEPTNHLDMDSLEWLINFMKNYQNSLLIVSHDKYFINQVTNKTLEIFNGRFYSYNGNYNDYLGFKEERDRQAEAQIILQQKKIEETEKFIERFRYKATKARQVQSRIKMLKKIEVVEAPENLSEINIRFPEPPKSGIVNLELVSVSKSYGNNEIFKDLDLQISRGDKIAFVGPNGAGKTTLAKILAGITPVTKGERIPGYNTIISYYAQDIADDLNPELDIIGTMEEY